MSIADMFGNLFGHAQDAVDVSSASDASNLPAGTVVANPTAGTVHVGNGTSLVPLTAGSTITTTNGTTITNRNHAPPLSKEEEQELAALEQEHADLLKQERLKKFKAVPSARRELYIDALKYNELCSDIGNTSANLEPDKAKRMLDLNTRKKNQYNMWGGGLISTHVDGFSFYLPLPEGLTLQDLESAHLEATMEEEVLNE